MALDKVMVVDDSATDSRLICNTLTAAGFETFAIDNASEALSVAKLERPDVILMDVVMSGTSGFQATRMLNRDPETAGIPVVIVSSKSKESDRIWGLRQGAVDYITKPFDSAELVSKLRSLV